MQNPRPVAALVIGLTAASAAATLVRLAQEEGLPSLVLAAGRLLIATAVLSPLVLARHRGAFRVLRWRDWALLLLAGVLLGLHFATWISSLEYTSVLASAIFVSTSPILVMVLSLPVLGERVTRPVVIGILVTFAGGVLVALTGDAGKATRPSPLLGNALALAGALSFALYLLIGRRVRTRLHVLPYVWVVYGLAGLALSVAVLIGGERITGYSATGYLWLVAIALIPQLVGHSSINYALGHLPAAYVSLATRFEPVGSTILALLALGEIPTLPAVASSVIILVGIAIPTWRIDRLANRARGPGD